MRNIQSDLEPVQSNNTFCGSTLAHDFLGYLMVKVQFFEFSVPLRREEKRSVLAPLFIDLAAGVKIKGGPVDATRATSEQYLALLN